MNDNTPIKQRLQIRFGKFEALIYTSNLDVAKLWERVLRRADVPILYSEGFNPRPRLALATALPLGISSECEILDVSLKESIALPGLAERLLASSPNGLKIYTIEEIPVRSPSLAAQVRSAEYRIHFEDGIERAVLEAKTEMLLKAEALDYERERKEKTIMVNLRPLIYGLEVDEAGDLCAHLAIGESGNARPEEVLAVMGLAADTVSVHRFKLHLSGAGER